MLLFDISLWVPKYLFQQFMVNHCPFVKIKVGLVSEPVLENKNLANGINIFGKILTYVSGFLALIAVVLVIYAGWLIFHIGREEEKLKKQKYSYLCCDRFVALVASHVIFDSFLAAAGAWALFFCIFRALSIIINRMTQRRAHRSHFDCTHRHRPLLHSTRRRIAFRRALEMTFYVLLSHEKTAITMKKETVKTFRTNIHHGTTSRQSQISLFEHTDRLAILTGIYFPWNMSLTNKPHLFFIL